MSAFYGSLEGEKKPKTKMGQRRLNAHIRAWDHGIAVEYSLNDNGDAVCRVYETGGSNQPSKVKLLKTYKLKAISKKRPGMDGYGGIGNRVN